MKWMFCAALGMGLSPVVAHAAERYAVLVGSNAEVLGRSPLRYAHVDAKRLAGALSELGEFDESNLRLLLDPRPQEVLAALDGLLAKAVHDPDAVLLFYYSGHADRGSLYPDGAPLPLSEVRKRLEDPRARLRLGIVDACEGGGWTGTKGFSPDAPIALPDEPAPRVEGTVFVASSSGGQSAHESDAVGGSFFTHHLVAALRGAADKDGDGTVSLSETFAYARRRTIRDAATYTDGEQSPSFRLRLTGREDVALSFVERGESHLVIGARPQLLQVVDLDSGAAVAEVPASEKDLTLALRAGRYLIRQRDAEGTRHAREVQLEKDQRRRLEHEELFAVASPPARTKNAGLLQPALQPPSTRGSLGFRQGLAAVHLTSDEPLTYFLSTGNTLVSPSFQDGLNNNIGQSTGFVQGLHFERVCTAPCRAELPVGMSVLGVTRGVNTHVLAAEPIEVVPDLTIEGTYIDNSSKRLAGVGLIGTGLAILAGTAIAVFANSPEFGDDFGSTLESNAVMLGVGSGLAAVFTFTGIGVIGANPDRLELQTR